MEIWGIQGLGDTKKLGQTPIYRLPMLDRLFNARRLIRPYFIDFLATQVIENGLSCSMPLQKQCTFNNYNTGSSQSLMVGTHAAFGADSSPSRMTLDI